MKLLVIDVGTSGLRAAIVEPGPTGVSTPSSVTSASPGGVHRSSTTSAWSSSHFCARRRIRPRPSKPSACQPGWARRARATISATSAS